MKKKTTFAQFFSFIAIERMLVLTTGLTNSLCHYNCLLITAFSVSNPGVLRQIITENTENSWHPDLVSKAKPKGF